MENLRLPDRDLNGSEMPVRDVYSLGPLFPVCREWNGKQVPVGENAEWIMKKLQIPVEEYRELAHEFNPIGFDAKKWVRFSQNHPG